MHHHHVYVILPCAELHSRLKQCSDVATLPESFCLCPHAEAVLSLHEQDTGLNFLNAATRVPGDAHVLASSLFQWLNTSHDAEAELYAVMLHDDMWPSLVYWHQQVGWECLQQYHTSMCCDHISHAAAFSGRTVELGLNAAQPTISTLLCPPAHRKIVSFVSIPPPSSQGTIIMNTAIINQLILSDLVL